MSDDDFVEELGRMDEVTVNGVYIQVATNIRLAVSAGDIEDVKRLNLYLAHINNVKDKESFDNCHIDFTSLITLACKHNRVEMLQYLFSLKSLNKTSEENIFFPGKLDEESHNALYYAVRSNDDRLLDALLCGASEDESFCVLAEAFEELKLKNVPLCEQMELNVAKKLATKSLINERCKTENPQINSRKKLIIDNIRILVTEYESKAVDGRFLFLAKVIAHHVHVLRQILNWVASWEHLDLCLVRFISSHVKQQEKNIIYRYVLTKQKIIRYLLVFLKVLVDNDDESFSDSDVMKELSDDYWQVQEVDTLEQMRYYAEILGNGSGEEGTKRAMEMLRRCLRRGGLSPPLRELLCLAAPPHLFHTEHPSITQIQQNFNLFASLISHVLFCKNIAIFKVFLKKILDGECLEDVQQVFHSVKCEDILSDAAKFHVIELLFLKLKSAMITNKLIERKSLEIIDDIMSVPKTKLDNLAINYRVAIKAVLSYRFNDGNGLHLNVIKYVAKNSLDNITLSQKPLNFARIVQISKIMIEAASMLRINVESDLKDDTTFLEVRDVFFKICFIASYETGVNEYMETFMNLFHIDKCSLDSFELKSLDESFNPDCNNSEINNLKRSSLRDIISKKDFIEKLVLTKNSILLTVEMLVFDILSWLCESDGLLLLDLPCSLVRGEVLRRYLLLSSPVLELSVLHPTIALIAIAYQVVQEKIRHDCRYPLYVFSLEDKYHNDLIIINNQQRMFTAAEEGNLNELETCVSAGTDLKARDIRMMTVLHYAAKGNNIPVLQFILKSVDICVKNDKGESPLHTAAVCGQINSLEHLLLAGSPVDAVDNDGKTPLHLAALYGHNQIVDILLKNNACPSATDVLTLMPLHYSVKNDHLDIGKILLKYEAHADTTKVMGGYTLLMIAAEHGHRDLIELFLQGGANVNHRNDAGSSPLHIAAHNGYEMVVRYLLAHGAIPNARAFDSCTPLHYAVRNKHYRIVQILLEHKADVNTAECSSQSTPLHRAVTDGQFELVGLLLQYGACVEAQTVDGVTPLHVACHLGHLEIVHSLISHKASIFLCNTKGRTALHHASHSGHAHIVRFLMDVGASVDVVDYYQCTPLHLAAKTGKKDALEVLIAEGAAVNAKDEDHFTPLHFSALNSHIEVAETLLKNGAHFDIINKNHCTPLHLAIDNGSMEIVECLLRVNANINITDSADCQPIHLAAIGGDQGIILALIRAGASPNSQTSTGSTPLHLAAAMGNKIALNTLIQEGAHINTTCVEGLSALCMAVQNKHREIVQILLENGSDVNIANGLCLISAASSNTTSIIDILLNHRQIRVNVSIPGGYTPLHSAAKNGNLRIVQKLIERGANVDMSCEDRLTALHVASMAGHVDIVKVLLDKGARLGVVGYGGLTPLHMAASTGQVDVVNLLLAHGAYNYRTSAKNTPLGVAAGFGHVGVAKALIQSNPSLVNSQENSSGTVLHIAAQEGHLEMCKYLISAGFQMKCSNDMGSKPIHIAARDGHLHIVEYLLNRGCGVQDMGTIGQSPLHYTAIGGSIPLAAFLLSVGGNINALDQNRLTPLHIAASCDQTDLVKFLLSRGAAFDTVDVLHRKPSEVTKHHGVVTVLLATEMLYTVIKINNPAEVKSCLDNGAPVEARNREGVGPLHVACQQGHLSVVQVLLAHEANAEAVDRAGNTPLHLACLSSNFKIVRALLIHGVVYNPTNLKNLTPLHFSEKRDIIDLFKKVYQAFKNVKNGQIKVVDLLNSIKDIDTLKAVMNSRNTEGKTLLVVAIQNNFPMIDKLKEILQRNLTYDTEVIDTLLEEGKWQKAVNMLQRILQQSLETLGTDSPNTWKVQKKIADVLYKEANYAEALSLYRQVHQKQTEALGSDNIESLDTWVKLALTLYSQCENDEALSIFRIVYEKQKMLLGANHASTLTTLLHTGLVLHRLQLFQEALDIYREVLSADHHSNLLIRNNIAMIYLKQGKYQESLDAYQDVYEASSVILGPNHSDTLRILHNQATVLLHQNKLDDALTALQGVFAKQQMALGPCHIDTLVSQCNIGDIFFAKGNWIAAYKHFKEGIEKRISVFGDHCPDILDTHNKMEIIKIRLKSEDNIILNDFEPLDNNIHIAASAGNKKIVRDLLECGTDPNIRDIEGRTPLHYAVFGGHSELVIYLLNRGADVTATTLKGNTSLHTAAFKEDVQMVESLLEHIKQKKNMRQIYVINATTASSGATALHIAAKVGSLPIVERLLNFGAIYNVTDNNKQTPLDLSTNKHISGLLYTVHRLFDDAKTGKVDTLNNLKENEVSVVLNARNSLDQTPIQVAMSNKRKDIANLLAYKLKNNK